MKEKAGQMLCGLHSSRRSKKIWIAELQAILEQFIFWYTGRS